MNSIGKLIEELQTQISYCKQAVFGDSHVHLVMDIEQAEALLKLILDNTSRYKDRKTLNTVHAAEISFLQENCQHSYQQEMPYQWAEGHFSGRVRACLSCGKVLEHVKE